MLSYGLLSQINNIVMISKYILWLAKRVPVKPYCVVSCRCNPCAQIDPKFIQLSKKYPTALFWKVDVDICRVSKAESLPTALVLDDAM